MVSTPAPQPIDPLRVTPGPNPRIDPIERWFVVLLRFIALLLLARSLLSWFILIGLVEVPSLGATLFDPPYLILSLVIVTATISVIAATGLWLLAPWGAVLWLSMVAADALLYVLRPDIALIGPTLVLVHGGLIAIYIGLVFQLRRNAKSQTAGGI